MVYNVHCTVRGFIIGHLQGWKFAHGFSEGIAGFFAKKRAKERFAQKNEQFAHSLIFGEQPE